MLLNPTKTKSIIIGSKHNLEYLNSTKSTIPKINVCDTEIDYSESVKYLGFHFNSSFSSETHVNSIIKNVNFAMSKINHCRNSVSQETKVQLIKGVVLPMFDYASIIYHGFDIYGSHEDEKRLNILLNSCVRFICNLSSRDHISEKYGELGLLKAYYRRAMLISCFIYNYLKTKTPSYLSDIFIENTNNTRAGKNVVSLMVRGVRLSRDEFLFSHCLSKLWNSIPIEIRNSKTRDEFSRNIKNYFLNMQVNSKQG